MTDYTEIPCPNCQRQLRVRSEYAGKVIACKHCEHAFLPALPMPCPNCWQTLLVPIEYLGQAITCGGCEHTFLAGAEDGAAPSTNATPIDPSESAPNAQRTAPAQATTLDDRIARVRRELVTEDTRAAQMQKSNREMILLRAQLADLRGQLERTREELAQVTGLREELEAARNNSRQPEVLPQPPPDVTAEVVQLSDQLQASRAEIQQLRGDLQAAKAAGSELDALRQQMSARAAEHEQHVAGLTAELDALRAAHRQTEASCVEASRAEIQQLRGDLQAAKAAGSKLDALRQQMSARAAEHEQHVAGLTAELDALRAAHRQTEASRVEASRAADDLRGRADDLERALAEAAAAQAEREALHAATAEEQRSRLEAERRRWEEHAAAAVQVEEARAELEHACQEWETRHQENAAAHEQRLSAEQTRAAEALRQGEQRHAEADAGWPRSAPPSGRKSSVSTRSGRRATRPPPPNTSSASARSKRGPPNRSASGNSATLRPSAAWPTSTPPCTSASSNCVPRPRPCAASATGTRRTATTPWTPRRRLKSARRPKSPA